MGQLVSLLGTVRGVLNGAAKWLRAELIRLYFGLGRIETVLRNGAHSAPMTKEFASTARTSQGIRNSPAAFIALFGDGDDFAMTPSATEAATLVVSAEGISSDRPNFHSLVLPNLLACIRGLRHIGRARLAATRLASSPFDSSNSEHETLLMETWELLQPGKTLTDRISIQWQDLGFQGADPATDFRSSGELGLRVVHRFAQLHAAHGQAILAATDLPYRGYPLALALIHTAMLALQLAQCHALDGVLGEAHKGGPLHQAPQEGTAALPQSHAPDATPGAGSVGPQPPSATWTMLGDAWGDSEAGDAYVVGPLLDAACTCALLWDDAWVAAGPEVGVMQFNAVWAQFRARLQQELLGGDGHSRSSRGRLPVPQRLRGAAAPVGAAFQQQGKRMPPFMSK